MKKFALKVYHKGRERQVFLRAETLQEAINMSLEKLHGGEVLDAHEIDAERLRQILRE